MIGAGPAGMAAAARAAELGLSAALFDEQPGPGGQIWRHLETVARDRPADLRALGTAYRAGLPLVGRLRRSGAACRFGSLVWDLSPEQVLAVSLAGRSTLLHAERVIVATGSMERPVPIPGWTLPGVMGAGAVQAALKTGGVVPAGRLVLAGKGPLLLQLLAQLLAVGVRPAAILDTTPGGSVRRAVPHLPRALAAVSLLAEGTAMLARRAAAGITCYRRVGGLRALGGKRVEGVAFTADGRAGEIAADLLALHEGVVPNTQMTRLIGAEHRWHAVQRCFVPTLDPWGRTSVEGVLVTGDGGGIEGAEAAVARGELAALAVAHELGRIDASTRDRLALPLRRRRARLVALRPFLEALYPAPRLGPALNDDATLVCRCEEVSVAEIRAAVAAGATGPNQAKAFTRCGMGPCQGRMCGLALTEILSEFTGNPPAVVGALRVRPPLKPLPLGELAALDAAAARAAPASCEHGQTVAGIPEGK